jgi:hypothetical protein
MKMNRMLVFAVTVPVCAGVLAVTAASRSLARSQSQDFIPGPSTWVAFDADYVAKDAAGATTVAGRYFRSSDGSWRQDGKDVNGGLTIWIMNVASRKVYTFMVGNPKWVVHPLDVPDSGLPVPPPFRASMSGLRRLEALYEGHSAYEIREPSGSLSTRLPDLNWFAVSRKRSTGDVMSFTNIQLRHQDAAAFQVPDGAVVEYSERRISSGMVTR